MPCIRDTVIFVDDGKSITAVCVYLAKPSQKQNVGPNSASRVLHVHGVKANRQNYSGFGGSQATTLRKALRNKTRANACRVTISETSTEIPAAGSSCRVQRTSKRNHAGRDAQHTAPWQAPRPAAALPWHPLARTQRQPVQSAVIKFGQSLGMVMASAR